MRGDAAEAVRTRRLPSYIPTRTAVAALIEGTLAGAFHDEREVLVDADNQPTGERKERTGTLPAAASPGERLRFAAERIEGDQLRGVLIAALDVGGDDIDRARAHLEQWFEGAMDRVSGWYKRRTQIIILAAGLFIAVALNVNTLTLADHLAQSGTLRRALVEQAGAAAAAGLPRASMDDAIAKVRETGLPIGWQCAAPRDCFPAPGTAGWIGAWVKLVAGFLVTALALSLGAPFWFDVLNRLMVIRATVKPREKSQEEGSEDRAGGGEIKARLVLPKPPAAPPTDPARPFDDDVLVDPDGPDGRLLEDPDGQTVDKAVALEEAAGGEAVA